MNRRLKRDATGEALQGMEDFSLSFLSINSVGIVLDFFGAFLIIYYGLWPVLNLSNIRLSKTEFEYRRAACCRRCIVGLLLVTAGFGLQLVDIARKYPVPFCC